MQKFFTNTELSKYIKSLLSNTALPLYKTVKEFDLILEGNYYIYRNHLIKCTKTGYIQNDQPTSIGLVSPDTITSPEQICGDDAFPSASWDNLAYYRFGQNYLQTTRKFHSLNNYYDSETHEHLGIYLRCLRDLIHINLMPFYNCFSFRSVQNIFINPDNYEVQTINDVNFADINQEIEYNQIKENYNTYLVPINFNQTYTIAIDSVYGLFIKPIFYNPNYGIINDLSNQITQNTTIKLNTIFSDPFIYSIKNIDTNLEHFDKYLYMLLQIPKSSDSSIVILEGDYRADCRKIYNHENINDLSMDALNNVLLSKLSLLQLNDREVHPFADCLPEYLLKNVITYQDDIEQDIQRIQEYISDPSKAHNWITENNNRFMPYSKYNDVTIFDNKLRSALYDLYTSKEDTYKIDINGWVDRKVEKFITKGFDV